MRQITDEDIRRLAKQAGMWGVEDWWQQEIPRLRRFLELVEAEKRMEGSDESTHR
jgi:hypothetical protein